MRSRVRTFSIIVLSFISFAGFVFVLRPALVALPPQALPVDGAPGVGFDLTDSYGYVGISSYLTGYMKAFSQLPLFILSSNSILLFTVAPDSLMLLPPSQKGINPRLFRQPPSHSARYSR
jgi:hypothetical protein